jgi:hypothetical protein
MGLHAKMKKDKITAYVSLLFFLCTGFSLFGQTVVIRGGEIHTMEGKVFVSGTIIVRDGMIVEIGEETSLPEDAQVIEASGYVLYPGFVASSGLFTSDEIKNFESYTPDASAADRFDFHGDYIRYLRGGVTSVFVAMPANRIISGKGMIAKLGSGDRISLMLKKEAALCVNLGKNAVLPPMTDIFPAPVSVENPLTPSLKQFPSSSLGAFWLLHELFRMESFSGDLARHFQNVSDSLKIARTQGLPLIVKAQEDLDIQQAIQFAESVQMPVIIQGTPVSYPMIRILKEKGIPVIAEAEVRPNGHWMPVDSTDADERRKRIKNIPFMIEQGIQVALTTADEKYLPDLFWIVQYFQRYGISVEEIVETITINPAKIFGIHDRIGSLAKGKDADILFLKKETGVLLPVLKKVMSQGRIVYEEK